MSPTGRRRYVWRKLSPAKWEDAWWERLAWISDRLAITTLAPHKSIRLEAFHLTHAEALRLTQAFGGEISRQKKIPTKGLRPARSPIRIRERLVIVASARQRREVAASRRRRTILCIPAGMAFGTGDHATTATCLRLLVDISETRRGRSWEMLDLGTGTGILAIAARVLGARRVEAIDFDASAVRIANENARLNGVRNVRARKLDVRRWRPVRTWDMITANLTGAILIEVAARIATAMARNGHLVFSGILREQEAEIAAALRSAGLGIERVTRIGKWVTGLATPRLQTRLDDSVPPTVGVVQTARREPRRDAGGHRRHSGNIR